MLSLDRSSSPPLCSTPRRRCRSQKKPALVNSPHRFSPYLRTPLPPQMGQRPHRRVRKRPTTAVKTRPAVVTDARGFAAFTDSLGKTLALFEEHRRRISTPTMATRVTRPSKKRRNRRGGRQGQHLRSKSASAEVKIDFAEINYAIKSVNFLQYSLIKTHGISSVGIRQSVGQVRPSTSDCSTVNRDFFEGGATASSVSTLALTAARVCHHVILKATIRVVLRCASSTENSSDNQSEECSMLAGLVSHDAIIRAVVKTETSCTPHKRSERGRGDGDRHAVEFAGRQGQDSRSVLMSAPTRPARKLSEGALKSSITDHHGRSVTLVDPKSGDHLYTTLDEVLSSRSRELLNAVDRVFETLCDRVTDACKETTRRTALTSGELLDALSQVAPASEPWNARLRAATVSSSVAAAVPLCRDLLCASGQSLDSLFPAKRGVQFTLPEFRLLALACSSVLVAVVCECGSVALLEEPDAVPYHCDACGRKFAKLAARLHVLLQATQQELETMLLGAT